MGDYRNCVYYHLMPRWKDVPVGDITTQKIEQWKDALAAKTTRGGKPLAAKTRRKILTVMHGVLERARKIYGLPANPVSDVELPRLHPGNHIDVFKPEEVWALVRAAEAGAHRSTRAPAGGIHATDRARDQRAAEDRVDASALSDRGLHWPSARGVIGVAVAQRRLRRIAPSGGAELRRRGGDVTEVGEGTVGPDGARGRDGSRSADGAFALHE